MNIIAIYILGLVLIATFAYGWIDAERKCREEKRLSAERRKRKNPRIVAFLKCRAKVLDWNAGSEDPLPARKDDNDPRTSKPCYLACRKNCKGFGRCPATKGKALSKEGIPLSAIGGAKVKDRFIDDDGSLCFVLDDRSDENVSIRGAWILYDNGDAMTLPRSDPGDKAGNAADKADYVASDAGDPLHE